MSPESRKVAGILLIILPTVMFGGVSILTLLIATPEYMQNELRQVPLACRTRARWRPASAKSHRSPLRGRGELRRRVKGVRALRNPISGHFSSGRILLLGAYARSERAERVDLSGLCGSCDSCRWCCSVGCRISQEAKDLSFTYIAGPQKSVLCELRRVAT